MKMMIAALAFCATASLYAQAPVPKALVEAKTVYLISEGASQNLTNDFASEMVKWGRFTLVDTQAASDITIALGGLNRLRG